MKRESTTNFRYELNTTHKASVLSFEGCSLFVTSTTGAQILNFYRNKTFRWIDAVYETWRIGVRLYVKSFNRAIFPDIFCYGRRATHQAVCFSSYFSFDASSREKLSVNA